jgi:hypothetical protein
MEQQRYPSLFPVAIFGLIFATSMTSIDGATLRGMTQSANVTGALPDAIEVSSHDNYLYFENGNKIKGFDCQFADSYSVTSGQPFTWPPSCNVNDDGEAYILFQAGRKDSDAPAAFFNGGLSSSNMMVTYAWAKDEEPEQLNFAFVLSELTVTFGDDSQITLSDIHIGQGSTVGRNDWWFGCPSCYQDSGYLKFPSGWVSPGGGSTTVVDTIYIA